MGKLTDSPQNNLRRNSTRQIPFWIRQLLRHMSDSIRRPDCERTVQHTRQESHAIGPTRSISPFRPHKAIRLMLRRHSSHHDNGNQAAHQNQEQPQILQVWQDAIGEDDDRDAQPQDQQVRNVDVPRLDYEVRVVDGIQRHRDVGDDLDDGGEVEDPAEEADPACEEAYDATPFWARGEGRPMVDTAGGGDGGGELGEKG